MDTTQDRLTASSLHVESTIELSTTDVASVESCEAEKRIRQFNNSLYARGEENSELTVPLMEYTPLNTDSHQARLLRLHPTDDVSKHICCDLEIHPLASLPPFIAVQNARGYRNFEEAIEIDGRARLISAALERFLRYLRTRIKKPTLIWVRYACVLEFNLQEQKVYWTREFSDKMYALASEIFDMHEVNNRLIENGYFEKLVDSRYTQWDKEWYGRPNEIVLPRVCPVRLGTRPDNDAPTMQHQYMPLDMFADEIRIICIMPAKDTTAPIVVHVAHCPIKCEVTYIALSYRWGTDLTPEHIVMDGQSKAIRKNLADAIRALRMTDKIIPMWIDAISINQDDIVERGRQVQRMGQIYDYALSVYSHLGQPDEDTVPALNLIEELDKQPVICFNERGEFHIGDWNSKESGDNHIKPEQLARLCASLYKFLTRQYFRRAWVLQEIAWASNPTIVADRRLSIPFRNLDMAAYHLLDMLTLDPALAGRMQDADPSLREVRTDMLAYPRKLFYFRNILSRGGDEPLPFYTFKKESPGYLEVLILARDFECTDPRDHIFALWNLPRDKGDLDYKPRYEKPYEEVYTDFTRAWSVQHGTLDILGSVEASRQSHEFYQVAPSWCPNWNVAATASCLVRKDYIPTRPMRSLDDQDGKLYSADGNMHREVFDTPLFSFDGKTLHCTGIILDQVKLVFGDAPDIPAGTAPKSTWRSLYWTDAIEKHFQAHGLTTYDDPARAACAMFHGDSIAAWPPVTESGYGPGLCHRNEQYVCLPAVSRHVLSFAGSYNRTEAWSVVDAVLRGRKPFITENGYMGLVPAYITEADEGNIDVRNVVWQLAVVAGCSVPLLMREKENGTYQLIGTCFVQGWMDGEWTEMLMGAESPKEFWEAMVDGARLVIT